MLSTPQVIIIGAGFGGLDAANTFNKQRARVLLIDRSYYHTFTPLLYQVASCGLDPSEVAYPIRDIFHNFDNVQFLMGEVTGIDTSTKRVTAKSLNGTVTHGYNYLIIAAGSATHYFGDTTIEERCFPLKELGDAVVLRNHILKLFEQATWTTDSTYRNALTTFVVVGGGPTGLETAGALHELYNHALRKDYRGLQAQVILIEASDRLLAPFPGRLQSSALQQVESLGIEVILNNPLAAINDGEITLQDGRTISTYTVIWSAGVKASPLSEMLGVSLQQRGRIPVTPQLQVIGLDSVYAVGDIAYLEDAAGQSYPQVIPVAKQQGKLAARNILAAIRQQEATAFKYNDRGIMATIGRSRAVAWIYNRIALSGFIAWLMWLGLHLIWLIGFRNRLSVLVGWTWNYLTYDRSVRIILEHTPAPVPKRKSNS